jgi:class 3 adenylate cyclase
MVGDSAIAVYRSARAAVAAAEQLRYVAAAHEWPGERTLTLNFALHSGEVVATGYGYFGVAVNRASTLSASKHVRGGRIVLSEATKRLLDDDDQVTLRELQSDGSLPFRIYELIPAPEPEDVLELLARELDRN